MPLRVAFISFAFGEYSIRLTSALAENVEVGLWLSEWQAEAHTELLSSAVDFRPFKKPRLRQPTKQAAAMWRLKKQIDDFAPDVIHIQQGYLWFNPLLAFLGRYPVVVTIHDPTPHVGDRSREKTPQWISNYAYKRAARLIVHNEQMKQVVVEMGFATDTVRVVPTVVRGYADEVDADKNEHDGEILFFGRIWEYKGLEYLIRAEPLITEAVPHARIVIAGQGEDFARYRRMMINPDHFIVHNEYVTEELKAELFTTASVVALPYIDATQSAVIATAYNYSKPVIATAVGGLPSMVDDGVTGYLIPPRDEKALADSVIRLLTDDGLRARMGSNAKKKASTEYGPDIAAKATLDVYRDLVAG